MTEVLQGRVCLPTGVVYAQIVVEHGMITEIRTDSQSFLRPTELFPDAFLIAPGFIDLQINGGFGKEFKTDVDSISHVASRLPQFGTTAFCPTVTTSPLGQYFSHSAALVKHIATGTGARFLGFHFEGPAFNTQKVGAQNASLLKTPRDLLDSSYLGCESLRIITFAPELDGASELVAAAKQAGIRVGLGHSMISYDALLDIYDPSCMMIVHLFNAMEPLTSREPGMVGAGLVHNDFYVSMIVDGIHTHSAIVHLMWKTKSNRSRIMCISDGSAVAGLEPGEYQIGDRTIVRQADRATLPNGILAGSVLTLNVAVRNLIRFTKCPIHEAINTVSLNPATYLGLERELGSISVGCKADLVVANDSFEVHRTYINGCLAYSAHVDTGMRE